MFKPEDVVTRSILERQARTLPEAEFITFDDGSSWTYGKALEISYAAANALRQAGIRRNDRVAIMYRNGPEFLRAWWGAAVLGARVVPVHTGYRGHLLERLLGLARPHAVVGDPQLMGVFDDIADPALLPPCRLTGTDLHAANAEAPALERPIETWETAFYLMTSGTTGPSKVAACTYRTLYVGAMANVAPLRGRDDCILVDIPLFHGGGLRLVGGALTIGARIALRSAPQLSRYWEVAKEAQVTMSCLISSMIDIVLAQPPRPAEREHRIRVMASAPLPRDPKGFMKRFGVARWNVLYGSTEVPAPLRGFPGDPLVHGYCGRVAQGYHCRIVDDNDIELPHGQPGELIVRHDEPWVIASYVDDPVANAKTWRNGWFHTGDMMRRDAEGRYFFVDRVKDSLRRRGENISSAEVEAEVLAFPGVADAACVAYRNPELIDDEVKVWIVPKEGQQIDYAGLLRFCAKRLPYFMVPRFFEPIDDLPRTHNQKIRKLELRDRGNSDQTWDREAHGFTVTRDGLKKSD